MLVISRKISEELQISDNIIIKIIDIDKYQVKIGIDAPRDISILRMELVNGIKRQNKLANKEVDDGIIHSLNSLIKEK
jgi:carbon storage regulator CsrA